MARAMYLSQALDLPAANDAIALLPDGDASTSTQALRLTLSAGVAFHNRTLTVSSAASLRGFRQRRRSQWASTLQQRRSRLSDSLTRDGSPLSTEFVMRPSV